MSRDVGIHKYLPQICRIYAAAPLCCDGAPLVRDDYRISHWKRSLGDACEMGVHWSRGTSIIIGVFREIEVSGANSDGIVVKDFMME